MRYLVITVIVLACAAAPVRAEDSYIQPQNMPADAFVQAPADAPTYDECFQLGWVRGVHVERGEWDDFYSQCGRGEVPFASGMGIDSVKLDHAHVSH